MTSTALKLYTLVVAVACAGAIAWSISQSTAASAWRAEAASWQATAKQTVVQNRLTVRRYRNLAHRYDQLVIATRRSQRKLIAQMRKASTAASAVPAGGSVPASAPAAPVAASAPAPVPVATTGAPTTHTS